MAIVIVAVTECYSDNNGAWNVAVQYDTVADTVCSVGGPYNSQDYAVVNATTGQIKLAAEAYQRDILDTNSDPRFNSGLPTYVGCIVTLKRARKAPNNVPVNVIEFIEGGYNSYYNRYDADKVVVEHDGEIFTVSFNCINEVLRGKAPYWAENTGVAVSDTEKDTTVAAEAPKSTDSLSSKSDKFAEELKTLSNALKIERIWSMAFKDDMKCSILTVRNGYGAIKRAMLKRSDGITFNLSEQQAELLGFPIYKEGV